MSLFDTVISALGSSGGGNPGAGQADLLGALSGLLGPSGGIGGLAGLVERFHQGGMSDVVNSWIGNGQNLPVTAQQITSVLGSGTIGQLAQQLGLNHGDVAAQLAQLLPHMVDHLTPNGQLPAAGAGAGGELASLLGGLLQR